MKKILSILTQNQTLSSIEAKGLMIKITEGVYPAEQIAALLTIYTIRQITLEELTGFRDALISKQIIIDLSDFNTIDLCGTGGDSRNTINISTLSAFVVAAAGYKVAKHGNYGVSSNIGSSNILQMIGYKFSNNNNQIKNEIDKTNISFLHAPLFNPALRNIAPIRQKLGIKTFLNVLGPIINPSNPQHQLIGTYNLQIQRLYHYFLQQTSKNYCLVHSYDGYDEVSLTSDVSIISNSYTKTLSAKNMGLTNVTSESISGADNAKEAVLQFSDILKGKGTTQQTNVVSANAGLAIHLFNPSKTIASCVQIAQETILSGTPFTVLKKLISIN